MIPARLRRGSPPRVQRCVEPEAPSALVLRSRSSPRSDRVVRQTLVRPRRFAHHAACIAASDRVEPVAGAVIDERAEPSRRAGQREAERPPSRVRRARIPGAARAFARRRLLRGSSALYWSAGHCACGEAGIGLDRDRRGSPAIMPGMVTPARASRGAPSRNISATGGVHKLERQCEPAGDIGRRCGCLLTRDGCAVAVQRRAERDAAHRRDSARQARANPPATRDRAPLRAAARTESRSRRSRDPAPRAAARTPPSRGRRRSPPARTHRPRDDRARS